MNSTPPQFSISLSPEQAWQLFAVLDNADERQYSPGLEDIYRELSLLATYEFLKNQAY